MAIALPTSADELTPAWFSLVFRELGEDAEVASVALERLGGRSSLVCRARLARKDGRATVPPSVIVKLPVARSPGRLGMVASAYEREMRFYRELAPRLNLSVPAVYWSDIDAETGDCVLVLEDFGGAPAAPDGLDAAPGRALLVLSELAHLHAAWWESPELPGYGFLRTHGDFIDRVDAALPAALPLFLERLGPRLHPDERAVFEALPRGFRRAAEPLLSAPLTLVHHDVHLQNVLIGGDGEQTRVVFIDWQLVQRSAGVRDVSFFVGGSLAAGRSAREERDLLRYYWQQLRDAGVAGYTFERLMEDYRRSVLCDFGRMVMTAGPGEVSEAMLAAVERQITGRTGSARELDLLGLL